MERSLIKDTEIKVLLENALNNLLNNYKINIRRIIIFSFFMLKYNYY